MFSQKLRTAFFQQAKPPGQMSNPILSTWGSFGMAYSHSTLRIRRGVFLECVSVCVCVCVPGMKSFARNSDQNGPTANRSFADAAGSSMFYTYLPFNILNIAYCLVTAWHEA